MALSVAERSDGGNAGRAQHLVGGRSYGAVMQFSVTTRAADDLDPGALSELAAVAEQAGWDGFFLEDYQGRRARRTRSHLVRTVGRPR
jgi:hypothetical protein